MRVLFHARDFGQATAPNEGRWFNELAQVELAQPYKRSPANPKDDALYILSELDNIDRHRAILVLNNCLKIDSAVPQASSPAQRQ